MKVVFLDIDGVLQPPNFSNRFKHDLDQLRKDLAEKNPLFHTADKWDIGAVYYDWKKEAVENLKILLEKHNALIVISSSWRTYSALPILRLLFSIHDLDKYVYDKTLEVYLSSRSGDIYHYLQTHPEIEQFVIIDDVSYNYDTIFPENHVLTNNFYYFDEASFEEADKILSRQGFKMPEYNAETKRDLYRILWKGKSKFPENYFCEGSIVIVAEVYDKYYVLVHKLKRSFLQVIGYYDYYYQADDPGEALQKAKELDEKILKNYYEFYEINRVYR